VLIQTMTKQASLDFLAHPRLGRLACARGGQPYITPIYFAHANNRLYSFSTVGQKIEWMRLNPLVCVEADEVTSPQQWCSVIVLGRYEELPKEPEYEHDRQFAHSLLQRRPMWWEPGFVRTSVDGKMREKEPVYFVVRVEQVSGRRATLESQKDSHR